MPEASDANRMIARRLATTFGGSASVTRYWDDRRDNCIDILVVKDRPQRGVSSYGTIGLSDAHAEDDGTDRHTGMEMLGVCSQDSQNFGNILASAAFCVINSHWECRRGTIFPDLIATYHPLLAMRHLFFVSAHLWEGQLSKLGVENKTVDWLLAIPISDGERAYAEMHGAAELERWFDGHNADTFNLGRPSSIA